MKPPQTFVADFLNMLDSEHGQRLFDALPGVRFYVKDLRGKYVYASRGMLVAHGVASLDDIIGRTDHDFIPHYLADHYVRDDQLVIAGQEIWDRVELVLRHTGCADWYSTSKIPLRSKQGKIIGLAGVTRDLQDAAESSAPYSRLAPVLEHIRAHFAETIELEQLARLTHLSPRSFQRHFQKAFHTSPTDYIRQFRVGKACQLLVESDASITAIANMTGFSDHSHLAREFARVMKMTPSAYRTRYSSS